MDKVDHTDKKRSAASKTGIILTTAAGWAAAVISLVIYPFVFGAAAIILGILISKKGSRAGMPLIAASLLLMAAGLMFNNAIYDYLKNAVGV